MRCAFDKIQEQQKVQYSKNNVFAKILVLSCIDVSHAYENNLKAEFIKRAKAIAAKKNKDESKNVATSMQNINQKQKDALSHMLDFLFRNQLRSAFSRIAVMK